MVKRLTTEEFIIKAKKVHGNRYNYNLVNYKNSTTPVYIICDMHGMFTQKPADHLRGGSRNKNNHNGCGCPVCGEESRINSRRLSQQEYIKRATVVHGNLYDYSNVAYKNMHTKINISCKVHGKFYQRPEVHLNGIGCPKCSVNLSLGEKAIIKVLDKLGINYETQKTFKDLFYSDKRAKLRYDFYLHEYNLLIEFHGEQHYTPVNMKGKLSDEKDQYHSFYHTVIKDQLKESFAESSGFLYEVIKYDDHIEARLQEILELHRG